ERAPGRAGADPLRDGAAVGDPAVAELARGVRAPAPELAGAQAAGVRVAGGDGLPAEVGADARRDEVVAGVAGAEVAGDVPAPAPEAAVGLDGAGVGRAGAQRAPARGPAGRVGQGGGDGAAAVARV